MDKIKPYLFWIICGVVLLIELAVIFMVKPQVADQPDLTAADAKGQLDGQLGALEKLRRRADATLALNDGFTEVIDPANAKVKLQKYIITDEWTPTLKREVEERKAQLQGIRRDLADRSRIIHEPVSDFQDAGEWYNQYESVTAGLALELITAGLISGPAVNDDIAVDLEALKTAADVRSTLDMVTTPGVFEPYRDEKRRQQLSRKFQLIANITRTLARITVMSQPNPSFSGLEGNDTVSDPATAQNLKMSTIKVTREEPGKSFSISLKLEGSPAALTAATRALDAMNNPITIRLGSRWTRLASGGSGFPVGAKHRVEDLPMRLDVELVVLDFNKLAPAGGEG